MIKKTMKKLTLILFLLIFNSYAQSQSKTFVKFYVNVLEFSFDEKAQDFIIRREVKEPGAISVDKVKIFIKGYDNQPDKVFKIRSVHNDEKDERDIYRCILDNKNYMIAITKDKKYLTLIGIHDKYIYEFK